MAVAVTDVALDLRLIVDPEDELEAGIASILTRHLAAAEATVEARAAGAPDALKDAAIIAIAAYLFDRPSAPTGSRFAAAWTNSGAAAMLARYVVRRARAIGGDGFTPDAGGGGAGGPGIDAVAREEAAAARAAARENAQSIVQAERAIVTNAGNIANAERKANGNTLAIEGLTPRVARVGDVQSVMVATAASYILALDNQESSMRPLWLVAGAAFNGNRAGQAFAAAKGDVYWVAPQSVAPELLFTIPQPVREYLPDGPPPRLIAAENWALRMPPAGAAEAARPIWSRFSTEGADLSDYRTAADQDIIDSRATAGILLARQEARAADGKATAAQEAIPADIPDAPAPQSAQTDFLLRRPAAGSASTEAHWVRAPTGSAGLTPEQAARLRGVTVNNETAARTAADTALAARLALIEGFAAPVFDPDYWVKSGDARSILVHLDPRAVSIDTLAKVRLTVQGVVKTVARTAGQDVYEFAFAAADAANITRAAGNAGADTVRADVELLDARDAELHRWRGLLRVLDTAPAVGGGWDQLYEADLASADPGTLYLDLWDAAGIQAAAAKYPALAVACDASEFGAVLTTLPTRKPRSARASWTNGQAAFPNGGIPANMLYFYLTLPAGTLNVDFYRNNATYAPPRGATYKCTVWGVPKA